MMTDPTSLPETGPDDAADMSAERVPTRRRLLQLGAIGAGAVVSIRPALAQTAGSVMNCEIPIPDAGHAGGFIADDGSVVAAGTKGAYAPPGHPIKGEDVKHAMAGYQLPGTSYESNRAYMNYIRRLQRGQGGFTCFASLQMPRG
jgi:hypothetical protein